MREEDRISAMASLEWEQVPKTHPGGQQAGSPIIGWRLKSTLYEVEIYCKDYRSSYQNKQMCQTLFELFIMERCK